MSRIEGFAESLNRFPCVAALRGLDPKDALEIGGVLISAGFTIIEVPLNGSDALKTIEILSAACGKEAIIGAGTVVTVSAVTDVYEAGGEIIVSPNMNKAVIERTKAKGLLSIPGVQTPSEALAGIEAGADALKFFPAESVTPQIFRSIKAVLPPDIPTLVAGSIRAESFEPYWSKGVSGCIMGSNLFRAGDDVSDVKKKANYIRSEFLRQRII